MVLATYSQTEGRVQCFGARRDDIDKIRADSGNAASGEDALFALYRKQHRGDDGFTTASKEVLCKSWA